MISLGSFTITTARMKVIIKIDLELTEKDMIKREIETSASVVDDKVTSKLLRQGTVCIVIDDD